MDLRELKKEVQSLPNLQEQLNQFQLSWVKPLQARTSPLLAHLDSTTQQELRKRMGKTTAFFSTLRESRLIQEKLSQQARYLVELKLSMIQGNSIHRQLLIKLLIKDPFLNLKQTIGEVQRLEQNISQLVHEYSQINTFLEEQLPLEGALLYADLPHRQHLTNLQESAQRHKRIILSIGEQFIALTRPALSINRKEKEK